MSLYVSIVLFSALCVFNDDHPPDRGDVFLLELGTTVGLGGDLSSCELREACSANSDFTVLLTRRRFVEADAGHLGYREDPRRNDLERRP